LHKIASWAHITNAHGVSGPSIITDLSSVGLPLGRGLLLLAEMSTKGWSYTAGVVSMARTHHEFLIGFIAQRRMEGLGGAEVHIVNEDEDFDTRGRAG